MVGSVLPHVAHVVPFWMLESLGVSIALVGVFRVGLLVRVMMEVGLRRGLVVLVAGVVVEVGVALVTLARLLHSILVLIP